MNGLFYRGPSLEKLHTDYALRGRIDEKAPVVSTSSVVVNAPVDRVWEVMSDLRGWPAWYPQYRVLDLTETAPGAFFRWQLGSMKITSRFAVIDPGRELTWTGVVFGFKAVDRHLLEPLDDARTRVTMSESLAGPFASVLYGSDKLREGHERYLSALKTEAEK
ncbi:hypothetical protein GCM10009555_044230 [Acrocarpospora macrocephala]|uniref:Polyketide cyclase n=1 Tax=Acrocarpospora macrocephala TaxID=150177 RepID=A0A5M3WDA9_9ACTN|nr:SRPBCC domain-containing protein [Acrocarpospora macrocephala]GES06914.1 hypothetical protein Amac_005090 [Acrocarpospora macrocephala]